jgi:hypothetical protein
MHIYNLSYFYIIYIARLEDRIIEATPGLELPLPSDRVYFKTDFPGIIRDIY